MNHPIYRVETFEIVAPYTLKVAFDDHTTQLIDFQPMLAGEIYGPLRDLTIFEQVALDPEVHTLVWPNGADFDPATLHDWSRNMRQFQHQAHSGQRNAPPRLLSPARP